MPLSAAKRIVDDVSIMDAAGAIADVSPTADSAVLIPNHSLPSDSPQAVLDKVPTPDLASTTADKEPTADNDEDSAGESLQLCSAIAVVNATVLK